MKQIVIFTLLIAGIVSSCTPSQYGSFAPQPTLTITPPPTTCIQGKAFIIDLSVQQTGATDFSLSAVTLSGAADIENNGTKIPTNGEWVKLPEAKTRLTITPSSTDELIIRLQVQSAAGDISDERFLTSSILEASELSAVVQCPEKFVNPGINNPIPIHLSLDKADFNDDFSISIEIIKGRGNLLHNGKIVNNAYFALPDGTSILQYHPEVLGEHIIDFTIKAGKTSTTERAYVDVYKGIVVNHNAPGTFAVTGIGEYSEEGKTVTLAIDSKGYNFEPEGWYSTAGRLLSNEPTCLIELHAESPDTIALKLKKRIVNIKEGYSVTGQNSYITGIPPQTKYVYYAYKTVTIDSKASEKIFFNFQSYSYNMGVIPPKAEYSQTHPYILPGYQTSSTFIRIDDKFKIYLRKEDNPEFKFYEGFSGRYIESATTRYIVPASITMQ